jgi:molybdopterin synthase sulfur carrier subunit
LQNEAQNISRQEIDERATYNHSHSPPRGGSVNTIQLEILPWLSRVFDGTGATHIILEQESAEGDTVRDLLERLTADHPSLGSLLYDSDGKLAVHISIIINNRLLELTGGLDTELQAGDRVRLLPAFSGG